MPHFENYRMGKDKKMANRSCDHGDYIVVYNTDKRSIHCPVCELEQEKEDLEGQLEDLQNQE